MQLIAGWSKREGLAVPLRRTARHSCGAQLLAGVSRETSALGAAALAHSAASAAAAAASRSAAAAPGAGRPPREGGGGGEGELPVAGAATLLALGTPSKYEAHTGGICGAAQRGGGRQARHA